MSLDLRPTNRSAALLDAADGGRQRQAAGASCKSAAGATVPARAKKLYLTRETEESAVAGIDSADTSERQDLSVLGTG